VPIPALGLPALLRKIWADPRSRWPIILFVLALAARIAWVLYSHRMPVGLHDPVAYDSLALGIADGRGYIGPWTNVPTAYFPPGYPAALAIVYAVFGRSALWGGMLNALLGAGTVVITYELARRLLDVRVARVAGLLLAFFPNQVFYTGTLLSEVLFTFLLMTGLLILMAEPWPREGISLRRLALAALFLGAATMVRSVVLIVPVVLFFYWLRVFPNRARVLAQVGVIILVFAAIIVPWTIRNAVVMHAFVLISTNGGDDFCLGNNEVATGQFVFSGPCYEGYDSNIPKRELEIEGYHEGLRRGAEFIINHPADELGLIFEKAYFLVYIDSDGLFANESYGSNYFIEKEMRDYLSTAANAYYFVTIGWAGLGLLYWLRRRDPRRTFCLILVACILLPPLAFFGDPRFHFPVIPLVCIVAATGVVVAWQARSPPLSAGAPGASSG
jgi:4-amino-4-deoxy-L-arabinose transferase-like glycosyltransferase